MQTKLIWVSHNSYTRGYSEIITGIPLYGRAFEDTNGIGQPYSGARIPFIFSRVAYSLRLIDRLDPARLKLASTRIIRYRVRLHQQLPCSINWFRLVTVAGAQVFENTTDVTSYSYDATKKELVSYDTPDIVKLKAQYINAHSLSGSMFWDVSIVQNRCFLSMKYSVAVYRQSWDWLSRLYFCWCSRGSRPDAKSCQVSKILVKFSIY